MPEAKLSAGKNFIHFTYEDGGAQRNQRITSFRLNNLPTSAGKLESDLGVLAVIDVLNSNVASMWYKNSGGFYTDHDTFISNDKGVASKAKVVMPDGLEVSLWLTAVAAGINYRDVLDRLHEEILSFYADILLDCVENLPLNSGNKKHARIFDPDDLIFLRDDDYRLPDDSKSTIAKSTVTNWIRGLKSWESFNSFFCLVEESFECISEDRIAIAKMQVRCVLGVLAFILVEGEKYLQSGYQSPVESLLNSLTKVLKTKASSGKTMQMLLSDLAHENALRLGSGTFEGVFRRFYVYVQLSRTNTYFSYYHVSALQGPHTVARTLSVRVNISILKRIISSSNNDVLGGNFSDTEFRLSEALALKIIEYVAYTLSLLDGLEQSCQAPVSLAAITQIMNPYGFTHATGSLAQRFHPSKKVADPKAVYCQEFYLLVNAILAACRSLCARVALGSSVGIAPLALSSIILPDNSNKVRVIRQSILSLTSKQTFPPGTDLFRTCSDLKLLCVAMALLQAFMDIHPCASAAVAEITGDDIKGKGESTLYPILTSARRLDDSFYRRAVDLRFGENHAPVANGLDLITEAQCGEYFPAGAHAIKARDFLRARLHAITNLERLYWTTHNMGHAQGRARQYTRELSPERVAIAENAELRRREREQEREQIRRGAATLRKISRR